MVMKKNFLQTTVVCLMVLVGMAASAQTTLSRDDMRRIKMQTINKRDASLKYQQSSLPQLPATQMGAVKSTKGVLPEGNVWFPGEWEEVKAIVVTCYYDYLVPGHENDYQWYADPVVSGVAEYIKYSTSGNYSSQGYGPYTAVLDSSSAFGKIFFYIMDAIQLGGAEAWVRVEAAEDSNIVLRTLERMNLRHDNVRFLVGTGNSFWYRDCGPICFYYGNDDNVGMLDFGYYPGRALDDSLPAIINQTMNIPNFITSIE